MPVEMQSGRKGRSARSVDAPVLTVRESFPGSNQQSKKRVLGHFQQLVDQGIAQWRKADGGETLLALSSGEVFELGAYGITRVA